MSQKIGGTGNSFRFLTELDLAGLESLKDFQITLVNNNLKVSSLFFGEFNLKLSFFFLWVLNLAARQMGFKDGSECPKLKKLADEYLKKNNVGIDDKLYEYFANEGEYAESLYVKLIEEFERCILAYFSFYWTHTSFMISQVLLSLLFVSSCSSSSL